MTRPMADRALMLAAPDLLALAKMIASQEHFEAFEGSSIGAKQTANIVNDWINAARAAIAKAEGK